MKVLRATFLASLFFVDLEEARSRAILRHAIRRRKPGPDWSLEQQGFMSEWLKCEDQSTLAPGHWESRAGMENQLEPVMAQEVPGNGARGAGKRDGDHCLSVLSEWRHGIEDDLIHVFFWEHVYQGAHIFKSFPQIFGKAPWLLTWRLQTNLISETNFQILKLRITKINYI